MFPRGTIKRKISCSSMRRRAFTHICWEISSGGRAARLAQGPELLRAKPKTNAGDSRKKNIYECVPFVPPRSDARPRRLAPGRRGVPAGPIPRGSAVFGEPGVPAGAAIAGAALPPSVAGTDCRSPPAALRPNGRVLGRNAGFLSRWNYRNFSFFTLICINILCAVMAG